MRTAAVVFAVVVTLPSASLNAQANGLGLGMTTCRELAQARAIDQKLTDRMLVSWVSGFLTGINMTNVSQGKRYRDLSGLTAEYIQHWVYGHCATQPSANVISMVEKIYPTLQGIAP